MREGKRFNAGDEDEGFDENLTVLTPQDIVNTMAFLIKVFIHEENIDDIDHLGNRRVRCVGELLQQQLKAAFSRMASSAAARSAPRSRGTAGKIRKRAL